ncbi:ABC-2 type transport system permease protein [Bacillus oleivorans]|uniref:Transport permease protein n=1 Tax=Bacillus oleivorans TaxID=1448271 RepID=A0A285D102_9BACI|nr:ABC transporter permease [Bacillus oleivorans]SNX73517.1 ABC-2 type transport system permease protein [Bacillus oleivorans]
MKIRKQFAQMFMAQLKMTFREKQAWFWGIFFPVILMVIFMVIFSGDSNDDFEAKVAIVDENPNETSQMLLSQIQNLPMMEVETGADVSRAQAETLLKEEEVDAVIVLPETEDVTSLLLMVNKENEQSVTTQAVSSLLHNFIQSANLIAAGATPVYEMQFETISSGSEDLDSTDFILTGMIALSIAQGGLFGMVDLVDMRRKGLMKRLRMTPARMGLFGLSDMTMRVLFACVQIILLSLIGVFGFGANLHIDFISLIVIFFIGALSFNALGYLFSSFSKTMESYMGLANITSFLMMFLSGIFFPVETMPDWLQPVSNVLPLTYFVDGLRDAMVYQTGIATGSFWIGLGIVMAWGLVAFLIGSLLYRSKSIAETR